MRGHKAILAGICLFAFAYSCRDFVLYDVFREELSLSPSTASLYAGQTLDLAASGGLAPYSYVLAEGSGSLDASSGLYTAPGGTGTVRVEAVDSLGSRAAAVLTLLGARPLFIVPAAAAVLLNGTLQFAPSGGEPTYSYVVLSGGASGGVNATTGFFTATAVTGTTVVQLSDGAGSTASATVSVVAPTALTIMPASATLTTGATLQFGAVGGTPPYTFDLAGGSGIVTAAGLYTAPGGAASAQVRVQDAASGVSVAFVNVVAGGALGLGATATSVPQGGSATFSAYGGMPPYSYSLASGGSGGFVHATSGAYVAGGIVGPAIDVVEVRDALNAVVSLAVDVVPAAPSGLFANGAYGDPHQIQLTWTDNSSSEGGFRLERRDGAAAYAVVGTLGANVTSFIDNGLSLNTVYIYRVSAFSGALVSPPSAEAYALSN